MQFIFLHGLGQSAAGWNETLSFLPEDIKADCPGLFDLCGESGITYGNMYRALEKYMDGFTEPVNLCGISLGAVLALNYVIDHAGKVKSVVLIAPQYKMPRLLLKLQNMIFRIMPEQSFLENGLTKNDTIRLAASMSTLNFQNDLHRVLCPVLIVCGKKDKANIKAARALADIISDSELCLMNDAGHEVNTETPKELAAAIKLFCGK